MAALVVAGCVPAPQTTAPIQAPTPAPATSPVAAAVPAPIAVPASASWMDAPQTGGDWSYRGLDNSSAATSEAVFADRGRSLFRVICFARQQLIRFSLSAPLGSAVAMTIRSESNDRSLQASIRGDTPPLLVADLASTDALLDAIALSKGRFAVEVQGQPALYLPSWPEISRVIEDCR